MSHETQGWVHDPHVLCVLEWCIQLKSWVPIWPPSLKLKLISLMTGVWAESNPEDLPYPLWKVFTKELE